jgi:hypothetical protein
MSRIDGCNLTAFNSFTCNRIPSVMMSFTVKREVLSAIISTGMGPI